MLNKKLLTLLMLVLTCYYVSAQNFWNSRMYANYNDVPELMLHLKTATQDTDRCDYLLLIGLAYRYHNFDSCRYFADSALQLANKVGNPARKAIALSMKGFALLQSGRLPESLQAQYEALNISEQNNFDNGKALALNRIGNVFLEIGDYRKALYYYDASRIIYRKLNNDRRYYNSVSNIGNTYNLMGQPDSALHFLMMVYGNAAISKDRSQIIWSELMLRIGDAYRQKGDTATSMVFYRRGISEAKIDNDLRYQAESYLLLAQLFGGLRHIDSSLYYARAAYATARMVVLRKSIVQSAIKMGELFTQLDKFDSAYYYQQIAYTEKDSLTGTQRLKELQQTVVDELERKRLAETKQMAANASLRTFLLTAGLTVVLLAAAFLYRNNRQKHRMNRKLEQTLSELKTTQSQLIHSEKLASLGELTAGIAHEIQNPLNFVNNFSEVSSELAEELETAVHKNNTAEALALTGDIKQNLQKILHHGRRADNIVKGMLQHSRSSTGQKEPTDINALTDEYLRLAYHGLRAKDKSFNVKMVTDYDPAIGLIPVVPQDMGRVILNLITNAFYAVTEKKKRAEAGGNNPYEPTVTVHTGKVTLPGGEPGVQILVRDNGMGIPPRIAEKIFQPFFTTKPTGQGTGLGLSMSYDIVVKMHEGNLKVNSQEGQFSEFSIQLPA